LPDQKSSEPNSPLRFKIERSLHIPLLSSPVQYRLVEESSTKIAVRLGEILNAAKGLPGLCLCGQNQAYKVPSITQMALGIVFPNVPEAEAWASKQMYAFDWLSLSIIDESSIPADWYMHLYGDGNHKLSSSPPGFALEGSTLEVHVWDDKWLILIGERNLIEQTFGSLLTGFTVEE
jgi:hypothetical protein